MALLGTLGVKLQALTADFEKGMARATGLVRDNAASIGKLTAVSTAAFGGLTAAIAGSVAALGEQREAEARLAAVAGLGGVDVQVIKDYAAALQQVTTFGDEATISGAAMLESFSLTEDQLITLIPRMQNLAAFTGTDLNNAALLMGKSITTSASALSRVGIVMTDVQKAAFDSGTQMERVALLAEIIDNNVGNAAETMARTVTGAFTQTRNAAGDVAEQFGALVEVPLTKTFSVLAGALTSVSTALAGLSPKTKAFLGIAALLVTAVLGIAAAVGAMALAFTTAGAAILVPVAIVVAAITALGIVVVWIAGLFAVVRKAWEEDLGGIRSKVKSVTEWIGKQWGALTGFMSDEWDSLADSLGKVWEAVTTFWVSAFKKAVAFIQGLFKKISTAAIGVLSEISPEAAAAVKAFKGFSVAGDFVADSFTRAKKTAVSVFTSVEDTAGNVGDAVGEAFDTAGDVASSAFGKIKSAGADAASFVGDAFGELGDDILDTLGLMDLAETKAAPTGAVTKAPTAAATTPASTDTVPGVAAGEVSAAGESVARDIGNNILGKLGEVGEVATSAMQGFATGGPWGALAAVVVDLLTRTEGFTAIIDSLNEQLDGLVEAIGPLTESAVGMTQMVGDSLQPIFEKLKSVFENLSESGLTPLMTSLGMLTEALNPIIEVLITVLRPVLEVLGYAIRGFAVVVGAIAMAIGWVIDAIIDVVAGILDAVAGIADVFGAGGEVRDFANQLRSAKVDLDDMGESLEAAATGADTFADAADTASGTLLEMISPEVAAAYLGALQAVNARAEAMGESATDVDALGDAAGDAAETFKEVSASLTNVPAGFKIAADRFAAIGAGMGNVAGGGTGLLGVGEGTSQAITIDSLILMADDPEQFLDRLTDAANWRNFSANGTPLDLPPNPEAR